MSAPQMSARQKRYARRRPDLLTKVLPRELIAHVASFLPDEGVKSANGKIISDYYVGNIFGTNRRPPSNNGVRYELIDSRTRPLTQRTKSEFRKTVRHAGLSESRRKNMADVYGPFAAGKFRRDVEDINHQFVLQRDGIARVIETNPRHRRLSSDFRIVPTVSPGKGTRNDFMRASKGTRAVLRPGMKKPPKKKKHRYSIVWK